MKHQENMKENRKRIQAIIGRTFEVIKNVYDNQREGNGGKGSKHEYCGSQSRIIFPRYSTKYRDGETRISEQELRFIFVEQFNKYCQEEQWEAYYSVETPTEEKYIFSEDGKTVNPHKAEENDEKGQSAMIDLCIHDKNFHRIALVEFKALNPKEPAYAKDFCKLSNESFCKSNDEHERTCLTFFIMIVKNHDNGTISNVHDKIKTKDNATEFYCYDLEKGEDISTEIKEYIPISSK